MIFNVTERENGQTRALQPQELFASQSYATNVYRSELAVRLKDLGYTIERGEFGQPEIKGYTKEYLEANSLRREQVKDHLRASGLDGPAAAQIAAHRTRDSKQLLSPEEVLRQHRAVSYTHLDVYKRQSIGSWRRSTATKRIEWLPRRGSRSGNTHTFPTKPPRCP